MKKNLFFLMLIGILVMAVPVAAKGKEPVGEKISVFPPGTPSEFPAGAPFHISHGWLLDPGEGPPGRFDFDLEVDGVLRDEDFVSRTVDRSGVSESLLWIWVHNFPDGMTGTHTFTGRWLAPCQYAVDNMGFPGPCSMPNAKVEVLSNSLTVTFLP
jgi:hypothetical protein